MSSSWTQRSSVTTTTIHMMMMMWIVWSCSLLFSGTTTALSTWVNGASSNKPAFVGKVAVVGATGRTGRYVVQELMDRNIAVTAIVRNESKALDVLPTDDPRLEICPCDLTNLDQVTKATMGCTAAIWTASDVSVLTTTVSPPVLGGWFQKIQQILKLKWMSSTSSGTSKEEAPIVVTSRAAEGIGIANVCQSLLTQAAASPSSISSKMESKNTTTTQSPMTLPQFILLSSAGVTRLGWDDDLKAKLPGCADIPIVRLNPGNILNIKTECEDLVRKTGLTYCIVRPCGLNDQWPTGSRPILSQGDVSVGRIHRKDVATVLVQSLLSPHAVGKTFEVLSLAGYSPSTDLDAPLSRLVPDDDQDHPMSVDLITTNYHILQQLLPGERQDAAALAMGQTYEQLDRGQEGRLGKRGQERIVATSNPTVA